MSNAFDHENTPYGAFGEFEPGLTADWTAPDYRAYAAQLAAEIAEWEAESALSYYDEPALF
jgi:hypothetical protein